MTTTRIAALVLLTAAACVACSQQEVTVTRNGTVVSTVADPEAAEGIDPCTALSRETLDLLGAGEAVPRELSAEPGCEWSGMNSYITPSATLWVSGRSEPESVWEATTVAGVEVEIWTLAPEGGRYIARFDDLTLSLNYLRARSEVPAGEALDLLMADVLRAYGRAET